MSEISVRTFDELDARTAYDLWRLRQNVFVVEQSSPYPDLDGRDREPTTRHLLAHEGDALIGCLRLLCDGSVLRIGRVAVAVSARGLGLASSLMSEAMTLCASHEVVLDAQTQLIGFYAADGFEVTGPEFDEDGVLHVPMRRGPLARS